MPNILDHVSSAPLLEIDDLPHSATCKQWFAFTRPNVQDTIAYMNHDRAAEAAVTKALTGSGLQSMAIVENELRNIDTFDLVSLHALTALSSPIVCFIAASKALLNQHEGATSGIA